MRRERGVVATGRYARAGVCREAWSATRPTSSPNIIIGSQAGLSYADFLVHLAPLVLVLLVVFVAMARRLFARSAPGSWC